MTQVHKLYNLGFQDGLNQRGIDPRYRDTAKFSAYHAGYEQGLEQRKNTIKRLIIGLKK